MNKETGRRFFILLVTGLVMVAAGVTAAACIGAKQIPISTVVESIFRYREEMDLMLVRDARLPRAIASVLVGGMLALTGAAMQGITRNPIAEPTILGMSQGATLAVAVATVFFAVGGGSAQVMISMIGALFSGGFVLLVSLHTSSKMNLSRLLLAGTAASTFMLSLASTVALIGNRSQEMAFWIAGGFGNTNWAEVRLLLGYGMICSVLLLSLAGRINIVNLGEEVAIGLGVRPAVVRFVAILLMIPICAVCVSISGNITFVGLFIPHIIRRIVGSDYRRIMPLSFLYGGALMVWADILARQVNAPYEIPIGLFTAIIGVPFFLFLVRKEKN